MGSTISILNDTESTWFCRVGPDEKALEISGIVASVVTAIGGTILTGGIAGLVLAPASASASGVTAAGTIVLTGGGLLVNGAASASIATIGNNINRNLIEKGYHEILSGATYETGKLSLSLWQQATCVGQEVLSPTVLNTKTLYMRPIFSGATHKSTNTYSIKEYLEGKGKVKEKVIKLEPNGTSPSPTTAYQVFH
jgi:hypothetical protein